MGPGSLLYISSLQCASSTHGFGPSASPNGISSVQTVKCVKGTPSACCNLANPTIAAAHASRDGYNGCEIVGSWMGGETNGRSKLRNSVS